MCPWAKIGNVRKAKGEPDACAGKRLHGQPPPFWCGFLGTWWSAPTGTLARLTKSWREVITKNSIFVYEEGI